MNRPRHTSTVAHLGAVASPAINANASDVDGALSRLSATVQTALLRAERNRIKGGRP